MHNLTATIARTLGGLDLLGAAVLAYLPETGVLGITGCPGLGQVFCCWGAAVVVAVSGVLLLAVPRVGIRAALVLGLLSLVMTVWLAIDTGRQTSAAMALGTTLPALPAIAQAAFGWLLMVVQRQVAPAIA